MSFSTTSAPAAAACFAESSVFSSELFGNPRCPMTSGLRSSVLAGNCVRTSANTLPCEAMMPLTPVTSTSAASACVEALDTTQGVTRRRWTCSTVARPDMAGGSTAIFASAQFVALTTCTTSCAVSPRDIDLREVGRRADRRRGEARLAEQRDVVGQERDVRQIGGHRELDERGDGGLVANAQHGDADAVGLGEVLLERSRFAPPSPLG